MVQPTSQTISDEAYDLANARFPGSVSKVSDGKRKVSVSAIPSPTDSGYGSGSSSSAPPQSYSHLSVPVTLESAASLEWCGFDDYTAAMIFNDWSTDPDLLTMEHHIVEYLHEAKYKEDGDWRVAMTKIGISRQFQDRIMTPGHDFVRSFHPLRYWLEEFIVSNFLSLQTLDKRIKGASQPGQTGQVQMRGGGPKDPRSDFYYRESATITLYRVTTTARLQDVFLPNDTHDLSNAYSQPGRAHDFGHIRKGAFYYFTRQEWVIQLYAAYFPKCVNERDVCVLKVMGKEADIAPLGTRTWRMGEDDEWRELVWHSKKQVAFPESTRDKHRLTRTFIGPICVECNDNFVTKKSYKDITKANVARKGKLPKSDLGMQWVFQDKDTMSDLNSKVKVDLFKWNGPENDWYISKPRLWVDGQR
jgi:hypothetical protein